MNKTLLFANSILGSSHLNKSYSVFSNRNCLSPFFAFFLPRKIGRLEGGSKEWRIKATANLTTSAYERNKAHELSSLIGSQHDVKSQLSTLFSQQETCLNPRKKTSRHTQSLYVFSYVQSSETRLMSRFINFLTKKGKKATAESIFLKTLYLLTKKTTKQFHGTGKDLENSSHSNLIPSSGLSSLLNQAVYNVKPLFEVKKVRVAGTTYQVPSLVEYHRQESLAINWLIQSASERKKKNPSQTFENCLAFEIFEAFQKQGQARNKRNELHKLAEVNRAFSHFRWW
jgi:small subunit ribosomal protein S7